MTAKGKILIVLIFSAGWVVGQMIYPQEFARAVEHSYWGLAGGWCCATSIYWWHAIWEKKADKKEKSCNKF